LAIASPGPGSADPSEECNSDDRARKLSGCSAIIKKGGLSAAELAVAYSRRSDAHVEALNLDQAIADRAKALELQPNDVGHKRRLSAAYQMRGAVRLQKKTLDGALADGTEALRTDPFDANAAFLRSNVHLARNDTPKAIEDMRLAVELDGTNDVFRLSLVALYERRAMDHILRGSHEDAIADYSSAIALDNTSAALFVGRGTVYARAKDVNRAVADYASAIRLEPKRVEAYIRRGELLLASDRLLECLSDLNEALRLDEKNVSALMLRALAREANGQPSYAEADYRAILKIDRTHALARARLDGMTKASTSARK
jgi:tetratricopeptide (TPR) repeat protein